MPTIMERWREWRRKRARRRRSQQEIDRLFSSRGSMHFSDPPSGVRRVD